MTRKMKIIILSALVLCAVFGFGKTVLSAEQINAYFFWGDGCPHCEKEKEFLDYMQTKYRTFKINDFEVYNNNKNASLLKEVAGKLGIRVDGVPATFIGDQVFIGYADFATPVQIENRIKECMMIDCPDSIAEIVASRDSQIDINDDANKKTLLNKLTKTTGGLVVLAIFGILAVGFVVFRAKK